jgi:hypothetical protein
MLDTFSSLLWFVEKLGKLDLYAVLQNHWTYFPLLVRPPHATCFTLFVDRIMH